MKKKKYKVLTLLTAESESDESTSVDTITRFDISFEE